MKIIEKFVMGKKGDANLCEDLIFCNDKFVAVIDGASSKSNPYYPKKKSGRLAAEAVYKALETMPENTCARDCIMRLNLSVRAEYGDFLQQAVLDESIQMFANLIMYSNCFREIWSFGDCQCLINKKKISFEKKIDIINAQIRAQYIRRLIDDGYTEKELKENDISSEYIEQYLQEGLKHANSKSELGYDVLNGMDIICDNVRVVATGGRSEIVLASDGYPELFDTLEKSEGYLAEVLAEDCLMYKKHKSVKGVQKGDLSFDDRAYIRFIG